MNYSKKKTYGGKKMKAGGKKKMGMGGNYMEPSKELTFGGAPKKMRDGKAPENPETFGQAFARARKELGPGKTFMYKGKKYSTNRADDKPKAAPKAMAKKSAAAVKSGAKKPTLQKSKTAAPPAPKSKRAQREDRRMDRKSNRMTRRGMSKGDKLRARADKADARMQNRRTRKNARRPQAPKGDMSKLNKDLKRLNQMQDGGLKDVPEGSKGKGLSKLPTNVRNKMGFKRYGGKKMMGMGGKKKAQFGLIGKVKGAIDGAKGAEGGFGRKLLGAAKGALGGGLAGRAIGAVRGAMGGGGMQGAMAGFKQGAFGSAGGGAQQAQPAAAPAEGQDMTQQQQARYGVMDRRKMGKGGAKSVMIKGVDVGGLTPRQQKTMKKHSQHHSKKHMQAMTNAMKKGMSFTQAHKMAQKKVGK